MIPSLRPPQRDLEGFTLIEIVVVLFILGVVISMAAVLTRGVTAAQKRSITTTRLAAIDAALVQFVQQQRRLPCPADGTKPASATTLPYPGDEINRTSAGCTSNAGNFETDGVVPWRVLGLSETDITDGWGRHITYRIDPYLAADSALDMTFCDPAGTEPTRFATATSPRVCNPACSTTALTSCTEPGVFLINKGLRVKSMAGVTLMEPAPYPPNPPPAVTSSGAAYVLISAGESGGGAYLNTGILGASTATDSTEEKKNYASAPFLTQTTTYYVDDTINDDSSGNAHFDDIVLRPSVMNVIARAGLGPRSH